MGMERYPAVAVERAMKVQEVFMQAMAKKISWMEAAEIMGITDRTMRRWKQRHVIQGYVVERRYGQATEQDVPVETSENVLSWYREQYFDFSVRHSHEKLRNEPGIGLS